MFLSQPLLDVLIERDIRDVDEFLRQPSFSDLADPFSIPNLRAAVDRVLVAIKEHKRIGAFGDYVKCAIMLSAVATSAQSEPILLKSLHIISSRSCEFLWCSKLFVYRFANS